MRRLARQQAGFSLFECVVATALLGAAILAGLSLNSTREQLAHGAELDHHAQRFLERELERVHAAGFHGVTECPATALTEDPAFALRRVLSVRDPSSKAVEIALTWRTAAGVERSESVLTILCKTE